MAGGQGAWPALRNEPVTLRNVPDITDLNKLVAFLTAQGSRIEWDRATGVPVHNALNWQDMRTDHLVHELAGEVGPDRFREMHTMIVDSDGNLYGSDNQLGRTQKWVPKKDADPKLLIRPRQDPAISQRQ